MKKTALMLLAALSGCVGGADFSPGEDRGAGLGERYAAGQLWGRCAHLPEEQGGFGEWGCEGEQGFGLACARPLGDVPLSICVPQTWDPEIDNDCEGLYDPGFGLGVVPGGSAYCQVACHEDADCGPDKLCSAFGFCGWAP